MHSAVANGASGIIAILMNEHPKFNVHCRDVRRSTPFRDAALHGHTECMRLLSTWSGSPILRRRIRFFACRHTSGGSPRHYFSEDFLVGDDPWPLECNVLCVDTTLPYEAAAREKITLNPNTTLLHEGAASGKTKVLRKALELGFNIDGRDRFGGTALMRAADRNNVPAFKFLFSKCADLYAVDSWGRTVLHSAAANGASDIIAILILGNEFPQFDVN